jgi:ADP-heptose:LPS heptosyltransferase
MSSLRILVVRNDKLGDFMLAWPALALLKRSLPKSHLSVLVPAYTHSLAEICPWVDQVLSDPQDLDQMNRQHFDAVLTLFSTGRIGWQVFKGRIPIRFAPATKWAQVFYNHTVVQRRSRSEKPEFIYNLELASALIKYLGKQEAQSLPPYWPIGTEEKAGLRHELATRLGLDVARPWFFLHSGSGGSANNLSLEQYAQLVISMHQQLQREGRHLPQWVLTCGPGEEASVESLHQRMPDDVEAVIYRSKDGLAAFAKSIATAQLMVAGSTGPLHIAGALDVPTIGFFPAKRSATPLRWRPCNGQARTLSFCPELNGKELTDMSTIDVSLCAQRIASWLSETVLPFPLLRIDP